MFQRTLTALLKEPVIKKAPPKMTLAWNLADKEVDYDLQGNESADINKVFCAAKRLRKEHPTKEIWWHNNGDTAFFWVGTRKDILSRHKAYLEEIWAKASKKVIFFTTLPPTLTSPEESELLYLRIENNLGRLVKGKSLHQWLFNIYIVPKLQEEAKKLFQPLVTDSVFHHISNISLDDNWDTYKHIWGDGHFYKIKTREQLHHLHKEVTIYRAKLDLVMKRLTDAGLTLDEIKEYYTHQEVIDKIVSDTDIDERWKVNDHKRSN
jgi:hypothetical protein